MRDLRSALRRLGCLAACAIPASAAAADFWNVGPMVHYEFGSASRGWAFGIEASYWWEEPGPASPWSAPLSVDAGIEFTRNKVRVYSEGQTGFLVAGISAGPFLELDYRSRNGEPRAVQAGLQYGLWGWWLAGINLRSRWSPEEAYFSPGFFLKYPGCGAACTPI